MYNEITLINLLEHKNSTVKQYSSFAYAQELISTPITAPEFYESCKDYPIVFVKDNRDQWNASVLLGYKEKMNIFIDENGVWEKGRYIPASIRRYPFIFISQETTPLSLGIDKNALSQSESDKDRKLFDHEGKPTSFTNSVLEYMNRFQEDAMATANFIAQLNKWELLEEKIAQIFTPDQQNYKLNGFFIINEEKLHHLSKKKKQEICDQNAYSLITAHLISLSNFQRFGLR